MEQPRNLAEPRGEPAGPVLLVPVQYTTGRWSLNYAVRCTVRRADRGGLALVRLDPNSVFGFFGKAAELPSVDELVREVEETARLLSLLLRDGITARHVCNHVAPHVGTGWLTLPAGQVQCRSASAGVLLAADYAERQIAGSALPELLALGALSEMG